MAIEAISLKGLVRALITRVGKVRDKPFDFQNFNDRLIVQKIAYLLVKAGIIKGLPFNYYLRGTLFSRSFKVAEGRNGIWRSQ
ncbi:MAG: hypothetical protein J7L79_04045 [Thaumarchaeota archaeon]|nr:hypothetical protein [Nitrososphaerota archaeon]